MPHLDASQDLKTRGSFLFYSSGGGFGIPIPFEVEQERSDFQRSEGSPYRVACPNALNTGYFSLSRYDVSSVSRYDVKQRKVNYRTGQYCIDPNAHGDQKIGVSETRSEAKVIVQPMMQRSDAHNFIRR